MTPSSETAEQQSEETSAQKSGQPSSAGTPASHRKRFRGLRHFLITLAVLFAMELTAELVAKLLGDGAGFHDALVAINRQIEASLTDLQPFALKDHFWDRLRGSHYSLRIWSFSEPFNATTYDKKILAQLKALRAQAPEMPTPPRLTLTHLVHGPNDEDWQKFRAASQQYDEDWKTFSKEYSGTETNPGWEQRYRAVASKLTRFDAKRYEQCMARSKGAGSDTLLTLNLPCFYDLRYWPYADSRLLAPDQRSAAPQPGFDLLQSLLGLPDAMLYTLRACFSQGLFQSFLACILAFLTLAYSISLCRKGQYGMLIVLLLLLPVMTSTIGWLLLGLVKSANHLLGWAVAAPSLPVFTGSIGVPLFKLGRAAFGMLQHEAAHKISHGIVKS